MVPLNFFLISEQKNGRRHLTKKGVHPMYKRYIQEAPKEKKTKSPTKNCKAISSNA